MRNFQNMKKLQIMIFVFIAVITLGVGYAAIAAINLVVSGNATAAENQENFKVKFTTANVTTGTGTAVIDSNDPKVAILDVSGFTKVGDTAVATYTILNDSEGIGARIGLKVTNSNSEYFSVTEMIADTELQAGDTTTATVTVTMVKTPIENAVTTSITGTLTASPLENAQATGSAVVYKTAGDPENFATDSWATIKKAVQDNNISLYNVGDTKTVTVNNTNYTVRIANKSTGEHCSDEDTSYSQTACGFVVEFVNVITTMQMKDTETNVGGYPSTSVFDYLNNTLLEQLPADLQNVIKTTRVVSGYGENSTDSTNFTNTNQKLYLLSGEEVFGTDGGGNNFYDTSYGISHQLEYYSNNGVTWNTSSQSGTNLDKAIKKISSSNKWWWLRSANFDNYRTFLCIGNEGAFCSSDSRNPGGITPAFRIG